MPENLRQLIQEHRPFYEVLPYNVVIEDAHGKAPCTTRRIQAGFDIDIYGLKTSDGRGLSPDYGQAYAILRKIVEEISPHTTNSCSIEVISFGSTVFFDTRDNLRPEAMIRIRITHAGNLDQPLNLPEQRALEEIEKQLLDLGIGAGRPVSVE
jgi:hypothetical protein